MALRDRTFLRYYLNKVGEGLCNHCGVGSAGEMLQFRNFQSNENQGFQYVL